MGYSVDQYIKLLRLAGRSKKTIHLYSKTLKYYAEFLGVDLTELHNHLTLNNLVEYADSLDHMAPSTKTLTLTILHRYCKVNKVEIPEMEANVLKRRTPQEPDDKPLSLETLQKMMDIANTRERAMITMRVSTAVRGGEMAEILSTVREIRGGTGRPRYLWRG